MQELPTPRTRTAIPSSIRVLWTSLAPNQEATIICMPACLPAMMKRSEDARGAVGQRARTTESECESPAATDDKTLPAGQSFKFLLLHRAKARTRQRTGRAALRPSAPLSGPLGGLVRMGRRPLLPTLAKQVLVRCGSNRIRLQIWRLLCSSAHLLDCPSGTPFLP